jgi:hypothetical protein
MQFATIGRISVWPDDDGEYCPLPSPPELRPTGLLGTMSSPTRVAKRTSTILPALFEVTARRGNQPEDGPNMQRLEKTKSRGPDKWGAANERLDYSRWGKFIVQIQPLWISRYIIKERCR